LRRVVFYTANEGLDARESSLVSDHHNRFPARQIPTLPSAATKKSCRGGKNLRSSNPNNDQYPTNKSQ
jgi:hypothetical protein